MRSNLCPLPERTGILPVAFLAAFTLVSCDNPSESSILMPQLVEQPNLVASNLLPATLEWQELARGLVALDRLPVLSAERVYSYLSIAQYAAIIKADDRDFGDRRPKGTGWGPGGRARFELERGAVTAASARMLLFFFPGHEAAIAQLARDEASARGATHPRFKIGLEAGKQIANAMILRAQNDRFTVAFTGTIPTGTGFWIPNGTPIGATGANVLPWVMQSGAQFRAPPPPAFGSAAFLVDLNEIRTMSDTRTAEQLEIAGAWAYPGGTFTPAGHWNELAGRYVEEHGLNERAAAHVFALMHAAQFDAHVIACSDSKYTYWYIRPSQADPLITTPIGLPNHPSYPSGHSCAASAATTILAHFFPDRQLELERYRIEAGLSRMYAGIHYRFDIAAAVEIGRAVAQLAIERDAKAHLMSRIR
jgi:membrane-associated phospholipid phosphatase